jgi:Flp pilus assembly protein TadD
VTAAGAAVLALSLGIPLVLKGRGPARSVAVLVAMPQVTSAPDERSTLAALAIREAILHTLAGLEGIEALGPDELPEGALSVQDAARAVAAAEIVLPTIACQGQWCRVSARRQRAPDARLVSTTGSFDVPSEPEDALELARAVDLHARRAFSDHRPRTPNALLEVRSSDYAQYLSLRRRAEVGEVLGRAEVDQLEQIARSSPGLIEAYLVGAATARTLRDRTRADQILQAAQVRYPEDPRVANERFMLELETGQLADAESALAGLERRAPGDVRVWRARGRLLSRQGRLQEAREVRRRLVRESGRPGRTSGTWPTSRSSSRTREGAPAPRPAAPGVTRQPAGAREDGRAGVVARRSGPRCRIYEDLLKRQVTSENLSNLGWSLLLAGEYSAAATAYRRALELEPDDSLSRLNAGIAEEGRGDAERARRFYQDLVERLAQQQKKGALTISERLIEAQALARLGDSVPAVALTIQALGEGDRDPQVIFQAAIIYSLCGEQNHAILLAKEARKRLSPRWFSIPGFERLRDTPAFRELLAPA